MIIKIVRHLIVFSSKIPQLNTNRKIISHLKIQRKKLSTLIPLMPFTLHLKFYDGLWQTLTKLKLRVSFVKYLIDFFYNPSLVDGFYPNIISVDKTKIWILIGKIFLDQNWALANVIQHIRLVIAKDKNQIKLSVNIRKITLIYYDITIMRKIT